MSEQAEARRVCSRRCAGCEPQFGPDVGDMPMDRVPAQHQPVGDLGVAEALGDQAQDFELARGQVGLGRGRRGAGRCRDLDLWPVDAREFEHRTRHGSGLPNALDEAFSGGRRFEDAMADYQSERDRLSLPFYEFTTQLATLQPLPLELERVLAAVHGNQEAMDGFARVGGAVTSPADFFSEENVRRVLGR
jgi:hypothetical protein